MSKTYCYLITDAINTLNKEVYTSLRRLATDRGYSYDTLMYSLTRKGRPYKDERYTIERVPLNNKRG